MSTQAQAPTPFGEESSNSQHDDPLRLIMKELQSLRDKMRDIRRDVTNLSNQQREVSPHGSLNATTQGAMDHSIALGQLSSTNLYILIKNFIHLLMVVEEAVWEEEACLDTLKKFLSGLIGEIANELELYPHTTYEDISHPANEIEFQRKRSGIMRSSFPNQRQVTTTKPPNSNFKPWQKMEEPPRGHYASSCPIKRALIFREDLNSLIKNEEDESGKCVEGEENGEDDEMLIRTL
ncbi:hypothetical protein M9H77_23821 [Catharanthus roseus]|uniref:Uncharacterized protein n=1 Tax=Catharanthus roseus TaxID=4058 RepID=A0ACC0AU38_CATRO|nr:hypothetical protein M9H77_23821 [Catharanthus roseus]